MSAADPTLDIDIALTPPSFPLTVRARLPLQGLTAVFGPSGAGKSTLLSAIAGFSPTGGRIAFGDEVWEDGRHFVPAWRRRVGFLFQTPRLFPHLDVAGNLAYAARRSGAMADIAPMVARFGLSPLLARRAPDLSGGEAQRVALVRALLARPRLLLMDEPLSALDAGHRDGILPLIEDLRDKDHLPILYVSHALSEVVRLATTVLALDGGAVVGLGPAAEVLADRTAAGAFGGEEPGSLLTTEVLGHEPDGLTRLTFAGGELVVPTLPFPPGATVRLLVRPREVLLSRGAPQGLSALNNLPATVRTIEPVGDTSALVTLDCGGTPIKARVTRRSVAALDLAPGTPCHAILKSVALAPG